MHHLHRFLPLFILLLVTAQGQPRSADGQQVTVQFSHSADNVLAVGGINIGDLSVNATRVTWRSSAALTPTTRFNYGVDWERFDFQRPVASAVPDSLQSWAVDLGASHRLNQQWLLTGKISPGFYGEDDAFNAPMLLLATWLRSRELAWAFGLRVDPFADRPVLPFVGVNWSFAPGWEFTLGMPRAGLTYSVSPTFQIGLGVAVQGGNFHVASDPRPASVGQRLNDTKLDYHEIRVGLAADWQLNDRFALTVETGLITDQKFDYFDRGYVLDGDRALYFSIGLSGRF